jgi:hypothetical protein
VIVTDNEVSSNAIESEFGRLPIPAVPNKSGVVESASGVEATVLGIGAWKPSVRAVLKVLLGAPGISSYFSRLEGIGMYALPRTSIQYPSAGLSTVRSIIEAD